MKHLLLGFGITSFLLLVFTEASHGIPLFGRKYNTSCFTCHISEPVLNEFGRRFKANGYVLPGTNEPTPIWDQPQFGLSFVAAPLVAHQESKDNIIGEKTTTNTFEGFGLDIFTAGTLGPHLSFFSAFPIDPVEGGHYEIGIESAQLIYANILGEMFGTLNARIGKMQLFLPFPGNLSMPMSDVLIYGYEPLAGKTTGSLLFAERQFATSLFGLIPQFLDGLRWELAFTNGTQSDIDFKSSRAVYLALNQTVFVDNAPVRFGAFFYGGTQDVSDTSISPSPWSNSLQRLGIDLEVYDPWTKRINIYGQYLTAKDDNTDNAGGAITMNGGFAGVNFVLFPEQTYMYARFDYMNIKETDERQKQFTVGLRHHLMQNVLLFGEVATLSQQISNQTDQSSIKYSLGALLGF